jgi:hypothetical protein
MLFQFFMETSIVNKKVCVFFKKRMVFKGNSQTRNILNTQIIFPKYSDFQSLEEQKNKVFHMAIFSAQNK